MAVSLPPDFESVDQARHKPGAKVNLIGIVYQGGNVNPTRNSSWQCTFDIVDQSTEDPLVVRFFGDDDKSLPSTRDGDVVLLRQITVKPYRGSIMAICSQMETTPWSVFTTNGSISRPGAHRPSQVEVEYANALLRQEPVTLPQVENPPSLLPEIRAITYPNPRRDRQSFNPPAATTRVGGRRFSLIEKAEVNTFVDLVCHVVKVFPENEKFLLYVTDYTHNSQLYKYEQNPGNGGRDGDEFNYISRPKRKWPGPFGKMTLQVTLWEPNAFYARENVRENDLVVLENVHIKLSRGLGQIEGAIHTDRKYPEKLFVSIVDGDTDDVRVKELVKRKVAYWKEIEADLAEPTGPRQPAAKKGNKRHKKKRTQEKKAQKKEADQPEISSAVQLKQNTVNKDVRSLNPGVPTRSLAEILSNESHLNKTPEGTQYRLPFQNLCYRTKVRVVDFFPHELEDFAVPFDADKDFISDAESLSGVEDMMDLDQTNNNRRRIKWEWRFCLLVEDGNPSIQPQDKNRMELYVYNMDAVHFLQIDPVNLRKDEVTLAKLQEKLFLLWGDLQERKSADIDAFYENRDKGKNKNLASKPFFCCIKEYGVEADPEEEDDTDDHNDASQVSGVEVKLGWKRKFQLFGTTILD